MPVALNGLIVKLYNKKSLISELKMHGSTKFVGLIEVL